MTFLPAISYVTAFLYEFHWLQFLSKKRKWVDIIIMVIEGEKMFSCDIIKAHTSYGCFYWLLGS